MANVHWLASRFQFVLFGALAVAAVGAVACQRPNPAYHPGGTGDGAAPDGSTGTGGGAPDGDTGTGGVPVATGGTPGTTGGAGGAPNDGGMGGTGGAVADGGRADAGNCVDNDGDGFGSGAGCLGADCDDTDATMTRTGSRACYTGPAATRGVGVCRAGLELCVAGTWSACNGQVLPTGEACNGEDDDCNGAADDKLPALTCGVGACTKQVAACTGGKLGVCAPAAVAVDGDACDGVDNDCDGTVDEDCAACVRVSPAGDDATADGATTPFRTLQAAINWAAMAGHSKRVCVAAGTTCLEKATYAVATSSAASLTMANGVSLYGNYEATTWTRCPLALAQLLSPGPNVTISTQTPAGIVFSASVTTPTALDGFTLVRAKGDTLTSTTAVTVDGARQVTLTNLNITDAPAAVASWGVNLINGAQATITRSSITAGGGSAEAIAVRSVGSTPIIRDNCGSVDAATGRCNASPCATGPGLRARMGNSGPSDGPDTTAVVLLRESPGAIVEHNAICGGPAGQAAGVRIAGGAAGTVVRGNAIAVSDGAKDAHGVWLDACGDAAPWIVDNDSIVADGTAGALSFGVRALGACHPVIDSNVRIQGGGEGDAARVGGVWCGPAASMASRCAVLNNKAVQGALSNRPLVSVGVACEGGGCARVAGNNISGGGGTETMGVAITDGGAVLENNVIGGGCGSKTTAGVLAENTTGRIENNVVRGAVCAADHDTGGSSWGLHIHVAGGGAEVEVHSNTIDAGGAGSCTGAAVVFGTTSGAAVAPRKGVFRNNILRAGTCSEARYGFWEDAPPSEPRVFENNDLDPTGTPTALYLDDGTKPLTTAAAVNALAGTMSAANISANPMFLSATDFHLTQGSACVNAGTPTGAPKKDLAGKTRDTRPDIGAYEQ